MLRIFLIIGNLLNYIPRHLQNPVWDCCRSPWGGCPAGWRRYSPTGSCCWTGLRIRWNFCLVSLAWQVFLLTWTQSHSSGLAGSSQWPGWKSKSWPSTTPSQHQLTSKWLLYLPIMRLEKRETIEENLIILLSFSFRFSSEIWISYFTASPEIIPSKWFFSEPQTKIES